MVVYELSVCGLESHCSDINLINPACFEEGFPSHSSNYKV